MLKFLFPFRKNVPQDEPRSVMVTNSTTAITTAKKLTPENEVIAISNINDNSYDFVDVDIRNLSYAEVAALTSATAATLTNSNSPRIVEQNELESDVSDYQMTKTLQSNASSRDYELAKGFIPVKQQDLDDGIQDDIYFNDKGNRRLKKGLRRKMKFTK